MIKKTSKHSVINLATALLPNKFGNFKISVFSSTPDKREQIVLTLGEFKKQPVLVRLHSQCFTGDTLLSLRCDCHEQLHKSMQMVAKKGSGVIIYLNQEGRGIGLVNKIKAYALQEKKLDTVEANKALGLSVDAREYKTAANILKKLGIKKIELLTNNPDKITQLEKNGIMVVKRVPIEVKPNKYDSFYLVTKKQKMGHILHNI